MSSLPRAAEYRAWWEENTDVPFGACWCGCGEKTKLSAQSSTKHHYVAGQPVKYMLAHNRTGAKPGRPKYESMDEAAHRVWWEQQHPSVPYGLCRCGCGSKTPISSRTDRGRSKFKGLPARRVPGHKRLPCDHSFFDSIDTEPKAYWCGFLAADGCVSLSSKDRQSVSLNLSVRDSDHVEAFRAAISSQHKITFITSRGGYNRVSSRQIPDSPQAHFMVFSERLANSLIRHGVTHRKTLTHEFPTTIPDDLLHHYVRGYIDGDGSFFHYSRGVGFSVVGALPFISGCREFFEQRAGFVLNMYPHPHSDGIYGLRCGADKRVGAVARTIYKDATIYLPRKRAKVEYLLQPSFPV